MSKRIYCLVLFQHFF